MSRRQAAGVDVLDIEDVFELRWLADVRISPDGRYGACVESRCDDGLGGMRSRVLVIDLDDGTVRTPSPDDALDRCPRWTSDGRLAFIAGREGRSLAWLSSDGHEPGRAVSTELDRVTELAWHPAGDRLVVRQAARVLDPGPLHEVASVSYKVDAQPVRPRADGGLALLELDGRAVAIAGTDATCRQAAWSADGRRLGWIAGQADEPSSLRASLLVAAADGMAACALVADASRIDAWDWSPDGAAICWLGHEAGPCLGQASGLHIAPLEGEARTLDTSAAPAPGMAVRADDLRGLAPDARIAWVRLGGDERIYCRWAHGGEGRLGWFGPAGGGATVVAGERSVLAFDVHADDGRLAAVIADIDDPGALHLADADGRGARVVADRNRDWRGRVVLGQTRRLEVRADDGRPLEAWLTLPPRGDGPFPLVQSIHGGPHYPIGWRFTFEHHRLAARGFAVLSGNPRGSAGYGDAFMRAVHADWGGVDHADVRAMLDAAGRHEQVSGRAGITGVSYGGYLTLWAIGQDQRYAAAVAENGISDLVSAHGTSHDAGVLMAVEMGGPPWERPRDYLARSPLFRAAQMQTPLLLLHAERDRICPIGQSEELFTALRRLGRTVDFQRAPGEGHLMDVVGSPAFRRARARAVDDWFDRYLRPAPSR